MRHGPTGPRAIGVFWVLAVCLVLSGCTTDEEPVTVRVCGDTSVPDQVDAVRVVLLDGAGNEVRAGVRDLVECPEDFVRPLPQQFEFQTIPDDGMVLVQGLADEVVISRARVRSGFDPGSTIEVSLDGSCIGIQCEETKTCIDGMCDFVPRANSGPLNCGGGSTPPDDTGMDAASDTSSSTADAGDTGPSGPTYCPSPDAGNAN